MDRKHKELMAEPRVINLLCNVAFSSGGGRTGNVILPSANKQENEMFHNNALYFLGLLRNK